MNDNWVIAGERNTLPKVGGIYEVRHSRKGTFDLQVTEVNDNWLTGVVVGGVAKAAMSYNVKYEGDKITIRDTMTYLIPKSVPA